MDVESASTDGGGEGGTRVAIHPLAIVHMSDQYTRISSGGSPLDKNAPVVGLLFGLADESNKKDSTTGTAGKISDEGPFLQVLDADDIPVEISDASTIQVDLHVTVFQKHKVVGWYRVSAENDEPTPDDLVITNTLKKHYAPAGLFCFCLLKVQTTQLADDTKMSDSSTDTLSKDLPINLYEIQNMKNAPILVGLSNWQLETSPSERLSIERVMRDRPSELENGASVSDNNSYVLETKAMQHSLTSMKDRIHVLVSYLDDVQSGKTKADFTVLRQIQQIVSSLGPLSSLAASSDEGEEDDLQMLSHLALVARTVNTIQSYTEKFRIMNENRALAKEMRRTF